MKQPFQTDTPYHVKQYASIAMNLAIFHQGIPFALYGLCREKTVRHQHHHHYTSILQDYHIVGSECKREFLLIYNLLGIFYKLLNPAALLCHLQKQFLLPIVEWHLSIELLRFK